jgi:uncharacterized repeat protein (TIGR02543 family)
MKKLTILVLVIGFIALLYGCCSHSSDGISIIPSGDTVLTSREVIIDELGRLPTVTFPSGAKIEGLEDNTLTPGIVVTIIEQKMTGKNTAYFNASNDTGMYIYKITAFMNPTNSLGAKTYVTTTEKPVKITLPRSQNSQGIILAGIKESDTDPWRLFNFSDQDDLLANIAGIRAVATDENTFSLFRFGTQFALVSYESNSGNRLPETYVTALNASSTPSILVKDGKYLEDLTIKGIIKGVKLDSIKPTDLRARITYRNNVADEAPIKVNGVNITQTSKADKTVPGYSYCHSFLIDSVSESNLMGNSGEFAFTLDLDGIETQSFSNGFLIEFFNKVNSEKILPYNYTEFYTVKQVGVYNIVYDLDGGSVDTANPTTYSEASSTFTLTNPTKTGYTFIGWSGTGLTGNNNLTVTIEQGSTGDRTYNAHWSEVAYTITYNLDGGTETTNPTGYNIASETFVLNEPTKAGYTFTGWTGSNGNTPQTTVTIEQGSTGDKEFTANWSINSYRLDIVKGTGINTVTGDGMHEYDSSVTASCTMLAGYEFDKWTGDITTETFNMPASNATMTANARPISYSIVYNLDSGQTTTDNPVNYDVTSATITLNNPTKIGYTFKGWSGTGLDGDSNTTVTIARGSIGHRSYTANYTPISYIIDYDLAEGHLETGVSNPTTYDITSATITISNPTRDGFNFLGWEGTDITEGTASDSLTIPVGSTGYRSYVASWTPAIVEVYNFTLAEGVTLEMRRCPAGTFTMGCPTTEVGYQSWNGEGTQHEVTISDDFYMGKFEVTQDQYFAVMGTNPSSFIEGAANNVRPTTSANYPVEQVSWNDIMTATTGFIDKINTQLATQIPTGYRFDLPTEAQWEYACRAGTTTALNNGKNLINASDLDSNLSEVGWYYQNWGQSNNKTHSVGALASNTFGLYDMHGNVFEWCKDWYASDYYTTAPATDPQGPGPDTGSFRVIRGGSWNLNPDSCRSAYRSSGDPTFRFSIFGFRVALIPVH